MLLKNTVLTAFSFLSMSIFAQNNEADVAKDSAQSYLEQVKNSFVKNDAAIRVDSLWMKELTDLDFFKDIDQDIITVNTDISIDEELPTELLKERLAAMNQKSPFKIEYNQEIENVIKSYLKRRRKSFGRLISLSEYYFPMFEEAFAKQNIPLEIKYLSVVESALNPNAVSRMGATGLWQFMYGTGKQYGLKIDSFIDERSDPLKSTKAASEYMSNMYAVFGDWNLVLASYNSGPGNVSKAIRRSGGKKTYWGIQRYLPKETQNYVPAFIATMYLYEYHNEHGIVPEESVVQHFETDTVHVKEKMSFKQISDLLDIPEAQIQLLNPSYKLNVIPFYDDDEHYLCLPLDKIAVFTSNEDKIYAYLDYEKKLQDSTELVNASSNVISPRRIKYYKVRRGDNLGSIANKYGVSVAKLKSWNKLKSSRIVAGKTLKIVLKPESNSVNNKKRIEGIAYNKSNIQNYNKHSQGGVSHYKVQRGDSLYSIAQKYPGITVSDLKRWNKGINPKSLKPGMRIKING